MTVSVIVPSYNGKHRIHRTLDALSNQSTKDFETILVIDGSTDDTLATLKARRDFTSLRIIEQSNQGRAATRNAGAKVATGDILVFADDDMKPGKDFIESHLAHHKQRPNSVLVGSQIESLDEMETDIQRYKASRSRKWMHEIQQDHEGRLKSPFITAANFSISKRLFDELDGFDSALTDAEDRDLAIRCFKQGVPIYFNAEIISWHLDKISARSYAGRLKEYAQATKILEQKHPDYLKQEQPNGSGFKLFIYQLAAAPFWLWLIDRFNVFRLAPKALRFRTYDVIFTGVYLQSKNR